ncbi:universal stress protein [Natrialbaceae archaeon A-gly3]
MFEDILIPTDGSETANEAVKAGIDLAVDQGATVHGLCVVEPTAAIEAKPAQTAESERAAGEQTVTELAELAEDKGLAVITDVKVGTPDKEILEYSKTNNIDLIVMGTHGRTGIDRYLLGSVTEKVVRLSEVPVLTIQRTM